MIAPLSDGTAHGMRSPSESTVVKDEPHTGAKTGKGGSEGEGDGDGPSMPGDGAKTGRGGSSRTPPPPGPDVAKALHRHPDGR